MNAEKSNKSGPGPGKILGGFLVILALLGTVAWWLCDLSIKNQTQAILNREQEVQRAWLDKTLDNIRAWRNEIVEQARYISSSEMFRLFVTDARRFSPGELESFSDPDSLHSDDDEIRTMAEQLVYMQDLLKDFTRRRAWSDARILLPDAKPMVNQAFSIPLTKEQKDLVERAAKSARPGFGPIRKTSAGLVMDMADPLFEVLGAREPETIAVLLLTVPLEKPLANFLARNREQQQTMLPRIVDQNGDKTEMALLGSNGVMLETAANPPGSLENMPFGRRLSLAGKEEVYSLAGRPSILKWLFVLETPAAEVDEVISQQKTQIYSLGALGAIGIALVTAFVWASHTSRTEKARAEKLDRLNKIIGQQRQILSCINKSNLDGLLLVDNIGRIEVCNPAFMKIIGGKADPDDPDSLAYALQDTDNPASPQAGKIKLTDVLPDKTGMNLWHDMAVVQDNGKSATVEIVIPRKTDGGKTEDCLYRVTIYPFIEDMPDKKSKIGGSMAIFTDITQFRRNKLINDARHEALISALGRAIESVDDNLVGHSDKMAGVAARLADELRMDKHQKDTLLLAARLSQIGKIFVPREILTRKGKLTPEELKIAQRAPEYADKVLHDLHFDLPVRETVREMGKSLEKSQMDGKAKESISLCGRALAVINAFIAMTSARAWRKDGGMDTQTAIRVMSADARFDTDIVKALGLVPAAELEKIIGRKA